MLIRSARVNTAFALRPPIEAPLLESRLAERQFVLHGVFVGQHGVAAGQGEAHRAPGQAVDRAGAELEEGGGSPRPVVERHFQKEIRSVVQPWPYAKAARTYRPV